MVQTLTSENFRITDKGFLDVIAKIPGGYIYSGMTSYQVCFPLKAGGELRFTTYNLDTHEGVAIDLYDGSLPPGMTGQVLKTGV